MLRSTKRYDMNSQFHMIAINSTYHESFLSNDLREISSQGVIVTMLKHMVQLPCKHGQIIIAVWYGQLLIIIHNTTKYKSYLQNGLGDVIVTTILNKWPNSHNTCKKVKSKWLYIRATITNFKRLDFIQACSILWACFQ